MPTTSAIAKRSASKTLAKFSGEELRMKLAELRSKLMAGMGDIKIAEEMGLEVNQYNALKREMYQADKLEISGKNSEEVFIDYRLRQEGCINDLESMIRTFKETKQYNAAVGAVKAKSDIIDKIVARGQEFGVLDKVPEKKQLVAGVLVAGMSMDELRAQVAKEVVGMPALLKKYGDTDILGGKIGAAASAALLPAETPKTATIEAEVTPPAFTAKLRPKSAVAGLAKVVGGKARAAAAGKTDAV